MVVSYLFSTSNHNCVLQLLLPYQLYLICFLHQTTTLAELFPEYHRVTLILQLENWVSHNQRSVFDAIFCLLPTANILKKFQLLWRCKFCSFHLPPKILYLAILLISYTQNTCQSRWWHRCSNSGYVDIHILL